MTSTNPVLDSVLTYLSMRTGKQIRPLMVLLAARMCHGVCEKSIQTAVALELLHTATLVHDDVVDSSDMRRSMPSVNAKFGNKAAVLTGDFLLAKTIELTAVLRNLHAFNIVAGIGQTLASGELLQLHAGKSIWIDEARYNEIIRCKTAALFAACMEAGAVSGGGTDRQTKALGAFGMELGLAFQLKDDILDYSDTDIGKPTLSDISDGKATLPLIIALRRAHKAEAEKIKAMVEALDSPQLTPGERDSALQTILSFVIRYDGTGYAAKEMDRHKRKAVEHLALFHDSPAKSSLLQLLQYCIIRSY